MIRDDTRRFLCNLRQQVQAFLTDQYGQVGGLIFYKCRHMIKILYSIRKNAAMLIQQRPQGVYISSALMHQSFPATENRRTRLLIDCLGFNETHFRLTSGDDDRLGISSIILLALHEGAHVLRRNQLHLVAKCFHLARPVVRAAVSLIDDN